MLVLHQPTPWMGSDPADTKGPQSLGPAAGTFTTLLESDPAIAEAQLGQPAVVGQDGVVIPVVITNKQIKAPQS